MEIVRDGDKQHIKVGELTLLVGSAVLDLIEDVKKLTREQHEAIIRDAGLTVEILPTVDDYELLKVAMSFAQNAWYTAQQGVIPQNVISGHESRLANFAKVVDKAKKAPPQVKDLTKEPKAPKEPKAAKPPKEPKAAKPAKEPKGPKVDIVYELAAGATLPTRGHDGLICKVLTSAMNLTAVTAAVQTAGGYETNDPLDKSVRYHLKKLVAAGVVKEVSNTVATA